MLLPALSALSILTITRVLASDRSWPHGKFDRVIMIGIDGFGGEYLKNVSKAIAPTMKGLLDSGKCAYSFSARAQLPTVSAPNWASILTGMSPSETGIIGNEWNTTCLKPTSLTDGCVAPLSGAGNIPPTMFHVGKAFSRNLKTASAYSWFWIGTLSGNDVDHQRVGFGNDTSVTDFVRDLVLSTDKPHVTFLHIDAVDHAGHSTFWGSSVYYEAVKKADGYVGQITAAMNKAAISDNTLLVITADHGGYRDTHEIWDSATANTPVLFCNTAGKIKSPGLMELPVVNVDYLPTIMGALGIPITPYQRGQDHSYLFERRADTSKALIHSRTFLIVLIVNLLFALII